MTDNPEIKPAMTPAERMAKARRVAAENRAARKAEAEREVVLERPPARGATRFQHRQPERYPERDEPRGVVVKGRNGEELTRKRKEIGDQFELPAHLIPRGWSYQWNTYSVVGERQTVMELAMAENGWRPVPADRHPGHFMPAGYKGDIIRGGLRLEERPAALTEEARDEERIKATGQVRERTQSLGLAVRRQMPGGFEAQRANAKMSIDSGRDIPRTEYQYEE